MKKIFTIISFAFFATQVLSQCTANSEASLINCFSQSGTVNITLTANITLTSNLVMSNNTTYNLSLGSFDIIRNGQSYVGGDNNTKIIIGTSTIRNDNTGTLTINGLNAAISIRAYAVILPIELTYFNAVVKKNGTVELNWQTASERNASHFEIERSVDATHWSRIATIKAKNKPSSYVTSDDTPLSIGAYYRLKQIDLDGKFEVFKNVFVERKDNKLTIFPNPTKSAITIVSNSQVTIYDVSGKVVRTAQSGTVTISDLPKGIFIAKSGEEISRIVVQ